MKQDLKIIAKTVCDYYGIDYKQLNRKERIKEIVFCRQVCYYFAQKYTKNSLSVIGVNIGLKDHATVIYGNKTIKGYLTYDKNINKEISEMSPIIEKELNKYYHIPEQINMPRIRDFIYDFAKDTAEIILKQLNNISIVLHISKTYIKLHNHTIITISI